MAIIGLNQNNFTSPVVTRAATYMLSAFNVEATSGKVMSQLLISDLIPQPKNTFYLKAITIRVTRSFPCNPLYTPKSSNLK